MIAPPAPRTPKVPPLAGSLLAPLIALLSLSLPVARAQDPGTAERILAIYLPGMYFAQIDDKVALGNELAAHLQPRSDDPRRLTPRVYATAEALDADAARIVLGLLESPHIASRLALWAPLAVAAPRGNSEARIQVYALPSISVVSALRQHTLSTAIFADPLLPFVENFLFEGELSFPRERVAAVRDVASLLSLVSLKKAEAVAIYEDDAPLVSKLGMRALYQGPPIPRPTLAAVDKHISAPELARLRDLVLSFRSATMPALSGFRATTELPYQQLRAKQERRPRRVPPLLEIDELDAPWPLPIPPPSASQVPLSTYAPPLPLP